MWILKAKAVQGNAFALFVTFLSAVRNGPIRVECEDSNDDLKKKNIFKKIHKENFLLCVR